MEEGHFHLQGSITGWGEIWYVRLRVCVCVRLFADVLNDVAIFLEIIAPLCHQQYFRLIVCTASVSKVRLSRASHCWKLIAQCAGSVCTALMVIGLACWLWVQCSKWRLTACVHLSIADKWNGLKWNILAVALTTGNVIWLTGQRERMYVATVGNWHWHCIHDNTNLKHLNKDGSKIETSSFPNSLCCYCWQLQHYRSLPI